MPFHWLVVNHQLKHLIYMKARWARFLARLHVEPSKSGKEAMASEVNALKTSEDNETSSGGTAESENTDVFEKIRRLFGDDIYDSLQSKS